MEPDISIRVMWREERILFAMRLVGEIESPGRSGKWTLVTEDPWLKIKKYLESFEDNRNDLPAARNIGYELFSSLPGEIQATLIANKGKNLSLYIESEGPWLPWEIMYLGARDESDDFLCLQYNLSQWLVDGPRPALHYKLERGALRSDDKEIQEILFRTELETEVINPATVLEELTNSEFDFWHFQIHSQIEDCQSVSLGGGYNLFPISLNRLNIEHRPIVFLASCEVAQKGNGLIGPDGWPIRFLKANVAAFLGSYILTSPATFNQFSGVFYKELKQGRPIAEAARLARSAIPFPHNLAITLFAWPDAQVGVPKSEIKTNVLGVAPVRKGFLVNLQDLSQHSRVFLGTLAIKLLMFGFYCLGYSSMRARERLIRIQELDYDLQTLVSTGIQLVADSVPAMVSSLFAEIHYIRLSTWVVVVVSLFFCLLRKRLPALSLSLGLSIWLLVLLFGVLFMTIASTSNNRMSGSHVRLSDENLANRLANESYKWLVNNAPINDRRREQLFGLSVWLWLASLVCFLVPLNTSKKVKWIYRVATVLLAFLMLRLLPVSYAYANWGLRYPQVTDRDKPDCCIFDVTAGAREKVFWGKCGDEPPGRLVVDISNATYSSSDYPQTMSSVPCGILKEKE